MLFIYDVKKLLNLLLFGGYGMVSFKIYSIIQAPWVSHDIIA